MTASLPETIDTDGAVDDVRHAVCGNCYPQDNDAHLPDVIRAVCGTELRRDEWTWPGPEEPPPPPADMCVVCTDLVQRACPRCGALP